MWFFCIFACNNHVYNLSQMNIPECNKGPQSSSVSLQKERQSNMELLRLLSILFVLVIHADYLSLGVPTGEELVSSPVSTLLRIGIEQFTIVCVNVFVLISGWFGIRFGYRGFLKFIYQILFSGILILAFFLCSGEQVSIGIICYTLYAGSCWWFVVAYMGLYVLAPLLNAFVEYASQKQMRNFLIVFFVWEFFWGWIKDVAGFQSGYSVLSFIGLYLLARYVRMYPGHWTGKSSRKHVRWYILTVLISILLTVLELVVTNGNSGRFISHDSPLVIFGSLCLLVSFSHLQFQSKLTNSLAASSFTIYLLHCHPLTLQYFTNFFGGLYIQYGGALYMILVPWCLIAIAGICTLADRVRLFSWNWLWSRLQRFSAIL